MNDDIKTPGTMLVPCAHPDCQPKLDEDKGPWNFFIDCLDPRLPDGPFLCWDHDPATVGKPMLKDAS